MIFNLAAVHRTPGHPDYAYFETNICGAENVTAFAEKYGMNYYRHIDRTKVQFDFFALEGSAVPQREEIEQLGGRVYIVPKYTHLSAYEKEIIRLFKQNQYTIVHSHMNAVVFPIKVM